MKTAIFTIVVALGDRIALLRHRGAHGVWGDLSGPIVEISQVTRP